MQRAASPTSAAINDSEPEQKQAEQRKRGEEKKELTDSRLKGREIREGVELGGWRAIRRAEARSSGG